MKPIVMALLSLIALPIHGYSEENQTRWQFEQTNQSVQLTDFELRVQWAMRTYSEAGGQTQVARSLRDAVGICSQMGFQLARINSFMEPIMQNGQMVGVSRTEVRDYWPTVFQTFSSFIASGAPRFFTADHGPFTGLGEAVVLFQPYKYPKWDFYSLNRQVYAEALCVRDF